MRAFALTAVAALMLSDSAAFAHAELASSNPPAGATVRTAPTEISITFTEEVEPKFSTIEVQDAKGKRVDQGPAKTEPNDAKILSVAVKPLNAGTYKVIWHAISSDDSHKTKGSYEFTIKP
jgi:methionine-rich copper-binding protein CopC